MGTANGEETFGGGAAADGEGTFGVRAAAVDGTVDGLVVGGGAVVGITFACLVVRGLDGR